MDWTTHEFKHVFHDKDNINNMQCVFFRFEFQNRNSIHIHMLVWLKSCGKLNLNLLSATIPEDDEEEAFLAYRLQKSDRAARNLKPSDEESYVDSNDNLVLKHTTKVNQFSLT